MERGRRGNVGEWGECMVGWRREGGGGERYTVLV